MDTAPHDTVTALRRQLLAQGFAPIPCRGKAVHLPAWTTIDITDAAIDAWRHDRVDDTNTGIRTQTTPVVDIDIYDAEVATEIERAVYEIVGRRGLIRIGEPPKRAIVFRTTQPFSKIETGDYVSPDGCEKHHVEILCDGQQVVVAGIHPVTGQPYAWRDADIRDTEHADLPVLTETLARSIVERSTAIMVEHGWRPKRAKPEAAPGLLAMDDIRSGEVRGRGSAQHCR
jgi:hypothetical protein